MSGYFLIKLGNGDALTVDGPKLYAAPADPFNTHQHFKTDGEYLVCRDVSSKGKIQVIDLFKEKKEAGSPVGIYDKMTPVQKNQSWIAKDGYYYSKLVDRVLTVTDSKTVVIDDPKGLPGQQLTTSAAPADVSVTFVNKTNGPAEIFWEHNGEVKVLTIAANQTQQYTSLKGSHYVAKDSHGVVLKPSDMVADAGSVFDITPSSQPPGAPRLSYVDKGDFKVELDWTIPANGGVDITGYTVVQTVPAGGGTFQVASGTSYALTLPPKEKYSYYVYATNANGQKGDSSNVVTIRLDPPPPTAPVVTHKSVGGGLERIEWTASEDKYYKISTYTLVITAPLPVQVKEIKVDADGKPTFYEFAPLRNTEYTYYVVATNSDDVDSVRSNYDSFTLKGDPPAASVLSFDWLAVDQVRIKWTEPANKGDHIQYRLVQIEPKSKDRNAGTDTTYDVNVPLPGTYKFYVVSSNENGTSPQSNIITFVVTLSSYVPPAPIVAADYVDNNKTKYQLSWFLPGETQTVSNAALTLDHPAAAAPASTLTASGVSEFVLSQLTPTTSETKVPSTVRSLQVDVPQGEKRSFSVSTITPSGLKGPASTPLVLLASDQTPSRPTLSHTINADGTVTLNWDASPNGGSPIQTYYLVQETGPSALASNPQSFPASTKSFMFTPTKGEPYSFYVFAENQDGVDSVRSSPSDTFTVPSATAPAAPVLTISIVGGNIHLSWTTPANNGSPITSYTVHNLTNSQDVSVGNVTSYDFPYTPGQTYSFSVSAVNSAGSGVNSNVASITAPVTPPNGGGGGGGGGGIGGGGGGPPYVPPTRLSLQGNWMGTRMSGPNPVRMTICLGPPAPYELGVFIHHGSCSEERSPNGGIGLGKQWPGQLIWACYPMPGANNVAIALSINYGNMQPAKVTGNLSADGRAIIGTISLEMGSGQPNLVQNCSLYKC